MNEADSTYGKHWALLAFKGAKNTDLPLQEDNDDWELDSQQDAAIPGEETEGGTPSVSLHNMNQLNRKFGHLRDIRLEEIDALNADKHLKPAQIVREMRTRRGDLRPLGVLFRF